MVEIRRQRLGVRGPLAKEVRPEGCGWTLDASHHVHRSYLMDPESISEKGKQRPQTLPSGSRQGRAHGSLERTALRSTSTAPPPSTLPADHGWHSGLCRS